MIGPSVCNMKFQVLFQKTLVIFSSRWEGLNGEYRATQWLNVSQTFLISIYWYFSLFMLKLTIMDLIRVIRSPFKKHGTYIQLSPWRRITAILGALSIIMTSVLQTYYHKTDPDTAIGIDAFTNLFYFDILLIDSVISLIYVSWYFKSSNFGVEIKRTIKRRHYVDIIGWILLNTFVMISANIIIFEIEPSINDIWILQIMQGFFYSQGFILPLFRILEPDFYKIIY